MKVHLFLPENDLALAANTSIYTPPTAARHLHQSGAALPLWYGSPGDCVICYGINNAWYERAADDFGLDTDVFDHQPSPQAEAAPWGWSAYARHLYSNEGFAPDRLPSDDQLNIMRRLSHRATGARIAHILAQRMPETKFTAPAIEINDIAQLPANLGDKVVKAPFSSSGRGVWLPQNMTEQRIRKIAEDTIRAQGSVMLEPYHQRLADFARVYECRHGQCLDVGTSVFTTDSRGAYTGNILAPEPERISTVASVISHAMSPETATGDSHTAESAQNLLVRTFETLRQIIEEEIAPYYTGVVGVDMLVCTDGTIDPVVELNLRTTMGYVACRLFEQHIHPDSRGTFTVAPLSGESAAVAPQSNDYTTRDSRLSEGTLDLVPPNPYFSFRATVTHK